jgi:hypothetical protein
MHLPLIAEAFTSPRLGESFWFAAAAAVGIKVED